MRRVLIALLLTMSAAGSGVAGTWRVEQDGSGQFTTLQPAVDAAASGDTILIGPGWYQELHWVDHYGSPIQVAAYWMDDRELVFVGAGFDQVTIGPLSYSPYRDGPVGIYHERSGGWTIDVSGLRFVNLYNGVRGANVRAKYSVFEGGRDGVAVPGGGGGSSIVDHCAFINQSNSSCLFFSAGTAEVSSCELGAYVYFGDTANGIVRNSTANGRSLCYYYNSGGLIESNQADCLTGSSALIGVAVDGGSNVMIRDNTIRGGYSGLTVADAGTTVHLEGNLFEGHDYHNIQLKRGATLIASGNDFHKTAGIDRYLVWCYDYIGGKPLVIAMENNFWGYPYADLIDRAIWDHNDDPNLMVLIDYDPFAGGSVPAKPESWGSLKAMFRDR
ncbi:MAG: right-handed parallel beta-helix repeat-containing protein [Candidatus Krumholzibacteriia bacterium]